ncbi:MAG: hypothetical protein SWH61_06715 [Thermodesulfobacteriota bacterium]|nr:hypothetical protein [Thermodesulfobacteriota bacterium]
MTRSRCLFMMVILIGLASPGLAKAEVFIEQYVYNAGESDSKLTCRTVSLIETKRLLLEKIGIYLQSRTEMRDYQITKDEVVALTAGIVKLEILKETWNGEVYSLTAKIEADPSDIARSIDELRKQQGSMEKVQKLQQVNDDALAQIRAMQAEMEAMQSDLLRLNQDASANEGLLNAWGQYEKAVELRQSGDLKEAIKLLNIVINNNPTTPAFFERGMAYLEKKKYRAAIADMSVVLEEKPDMRGALWARGIARMNMGDRSGRIDLEKAADLGSPMAKKWLRAHPAWRD